MDHVERLAPAASWSVVFSGGGLIQAFGRATVLPGDIVIADESGVLFIPPQLVEQVLAKARAKVSMENYQRELLRTKQHRFGDIYPVLAPELLEEYERRTNLNN